MPAGLFDYNGILNTFLTQDVLSSTEQSFSFFSVKPVDKVCIVVFIGSFIPVK